ncbi:MAG: hypothetical protein GF414_00845 [Candidatus Altiarchaeales archaeon]|nr:hypothetical protein [Candidatus Altiarchaeales archaeon]
MRVAVVGAGPAGVSAAYFLRHYDEDSSLSVDLFDRLEPRKYEEYHDMCGEAVSKKTFEDIKPIKKNSITGKIKQIREFYPGDIEIKTDMDGLLINRGEFFRSIIKAFSDNGGEFHIGEINDFSQDNEVVKLKIEDKTEKYDYVIAADGPNSMIRDRLGVKSRTKTLIQYIVDEEPEEETIQFYYDEKYEGDYLWKFPHEGKTKIGYPFIKGKDFTPKEKILKKQARTVAFGGVDQLIHNRILLMGDAACQTNPITKGGIRAAMVAGKLAAKAIANDNPYQYQKEWEKTGFTNPIFTKAFKQLKQMNNNELEKHIKIIEEINTNNYLLKYFIILRIIIFYREYLELLKSYELCDIMGW